MSTITKIKKRNGEVVAFDQNKITEAIWKAAQSVGGTNREIAAKISSQVTTVLEVFFKSDINIPSVEQIQDLVEKILIENGHAKTAKAYILYRQEHTKLRHQRQKILAAKGDLMIHLPPEIKENDIHEFLNFAEKLGCNYSAVEPEMNESEDEESSEISFHDRPSGLKKMAEEVVPPPIQALL